MIDFEEALNHSISTVPLSIFNADESVCKASKKILASIFMSKSNEENTDASKENTTLLISWHRCVC